MSRETHPNWIGGAWKPGSGETFSSCNPSSGEVLRESASAGPAEVDAAVEAARSAFPDWSGCALEDRVSLLETFARLLADHRDEYAGTISQEIGKPRWESLTEVDAMASKIRFSIQAYHERREPVIQGASATRFKPHGVAAVFGPFNLPGHLPNAHIVPALLAGNMVVFKPSERAPLTGHYLTRLWTEAGLPPGVFNLVQGPRPTGELLVAHRDLDAIYFTGGVAGGLAIAKARVETPGVIVALEMGGNNPLVVWEPCEVDAAVYTTILSAFITSGQRCTCARRLILPVGTFGDRFLERLLEVAGTLRIGPPDLDPEPFLGPVIDAETARNLLSAQDDLIATGARPLLPMKSVGTGGTFLSPGILDVSAIIDRSDREFFGPLLQVIRVPDYPTALAEANRTAYGLSAGLLCTDRARWESFFRESRAGIVNWNRAITGASGSQPFGGTGLSGNHRPSGSYAADYCSYPVASTEADSPTLPPTLAPGIRM